jgi:hypothetical protein
LELHLLQNAVAHWEHHIAVMVRTVAMTIKPITRAPRDGADAHSESGT